MARPAPGPPDQPAHRPSPRRRGAPGRRYAARRGPAAPGVTAPLALVGSAGLGRIDLRPRRRRRIRWPIPVLAVTTMTLVLAMHVTRPIPAPAFTAAAPAPVTIPGPAPALQWPSVGQAAVSVPGTGMLLQSGTESPVPVASLTKIMTAYLVLRDHPLAADDTGPQVVMTAEDEADSAANARANATSIPVVAGQSFSERQLLDSLIVHSANDFADALARWDAGSVAAFVAKMNVEATALGMRATRYTDPSGIDQADMSTAADQLRLSEAAMSIPAFAAVAAQPTITVPGVGLLANYVPAVGSDGVVGVKSGFTQAAMGCVVIAAERQVAGGTQLVLAALTGQQGGADPIRAADRTAIALIDATAPVLQRQSVLGARRQVGTVRAPWAPRGVSVVTRSGVTALVWPGESVRYDVRVGPIRPGLRAGQVVGRLIVHVGSGDVVVPLVSTGAVPGPPLHWRFAHN